MTDVSININVKGSHFLTPHRAEFQLSVAGDSFTSSSLCGEKRNGEDTAERRRNAATHVQLPGFLLSAPRTARIHPERRGKVSRCHSASGKKMFSSPITAAVEVEVVVKVVEVVVRFNSLQSAGQCEEESGNRRQTERERGGERERLRERERD